MASPKKEKRAAEDTAEGVGRSILVKGILMNSCTDTTKEAQEREEG